MLLYSTPVCSAVITSYPSLSKVLACSMKTQYDYPKLAIPLPHPSILKGGAPLPTHPHTCPGSTLVKPASQSSQAAHQQACPLLHREGQQQLPCQHSKVRSKLTLWLSISAVLAGMSKWDCTGHILCGPNRLSQIMSNCCYTTAPACNGVGLVRSRGLQQNHQVVWLQMQADSQWQS